MVTGGPSHKSALGIRSRPTQGVGLGRPASSGRQLAHLHLALSRNSKSHLKLLKKIERAIPRGLIYLIADNLKIHDSALVREWLEGHQRIEHAFIPKGAAWLNLR